MTVLLPTLAHRNNGQTFFMLASVKLKPHAAAGSSFPGTLKTSLCATRLFPTAECPERNFLRLHAQGCGSTSIFRSHKEQCFGKSSGIKLEPTLLSGFETPAGVVGFPVPAASDVGNIRGAHRESRASVGREYGAAHAEVVGESEHRRESRNPAEKIAVTHPRKTQK